MSRWRSALLLCPLVACGCSVLNDMGSYSGGRPADSAVVDTSIRDTEAPDTTEAVETEIADSNEVDTSTDSRPDSTSDTGVIVAADSGLDARDASDTGVDAVADVPVGDTSLGCHVVINEVQTRSVATGFDEFIELYNPCDADITLTGWKLVYRSAAGATESLLVPSFPATAKVASKGFFLVGNAAGAYAAMSDVTFTAGMGDDGAAALRDPAGTLADSVSWGTVVATHPFTEKMPAPGPASGASIARQPAGADTNDNSVDFKKLTTSTPKAG